MFLGGYRSDLIVILGVQNLQAAEAPAATPEAGSCFLEARRRTDMFDQSIDRSRPKHQLRWLG